MRIPDQVTARQAETATARDQATSPRITLDEIT